jgi:hypothetical protein
MHIVKVLSLNIKLIILIKLSNLKKLLTLLKKKKSAKKNKFNKEPSITANLLALIIVAVCRIIAALTIIKPLPVNISQKNVHIIIT